MALLSSYLLTTKNVERFFNSLATAQAPKVFTQKFLEGLDFKSTNDRLFIRLLKGLGFLDATGTPTTRYFHFLDQSRSKQVLADAIRESYSDLFDLNINAQKMTVTEVKNKLRTLTQGQYSENVILLMANTFTALCSYAEWSSPKTTVQMNEARPAEVEDKKEQQPESDDLPAPIQTQRPHELHYNIQIHLPESRDPAVYDALFKSLNKHLL